MRSILVWNCQGVGHKNFLSQLKTILGDSNPYVVVLLETRVAGQKGLPLFNALGFDMVEVMEGSGFSGGI